MRPHALARLCSLLLMLLLLGTGTAPAQARNLRLKGTADPLTAPQPRPGELPVWETSYEAALALAGDGRAGAGASSNPLGNDTTSLTGNSPGQDGPARRGPAAAVTVNVAISQGRYSISPFVYGVNYATDFNALSDAGIQIMRRGGNADSRYNWQIDTYNRAADSFFMNQAKTMAGQTSSWDTMQQGLLDRNITTIAQIPVLNWLPRTRAPGCSYSVKKYGAQQSQSGDCGNGYLKNGRPVKNDRNDVSAPTDENFQQSWVAHLTQKFGPSKKAGQRLRYYSMDNEPAWWGGLHRDIHNYASTYDEIVQKSLTFAPLVKKADPTARILGPVTAGWADTFFSMKDMQSGWATKPWKYWSNPVDRKAHGNKPFIQYYLEQMKAYEQKNGTRLIDIVDLHGYVTPSNDNTDPQSQAQRINDVRKLWDPQYNCWNQNGCLDPISAPDGVPRFISRVQDIITNTYPGLGVALTEYNFAGNADISGAIAQAEVLANLGKLGVTIATVFPNPAPTSTVYQAFKMFGNFDGKGTKYGSIGVSANSTDYLQVSSYASIDDAAKTLTILLTSLKPRDAQVTLNLNDVNPTKTINAYRYSSANLKQILALPSIKPSKSLVLTIPGYSLTMLVVPLA